MKGKVTLSRAENPSDLRERCNRPNLVRRRSKEGVQMAARPQYFPTGTNLWVKLASQNGGDGKQPVAEGQYHTWEDNLTELKICGDGPSELCEQASHDGKGVGSGTSDTDGYIREGGYSSLQGRSNGSLIGKCSRQKGGKCKKRGNESILEGRSMHENILTNL
jgi:hypothetical protein